MGRKALRASSAVALVVLLLAACTPAEQVVVPLTTPVGFMAAKPVSFEGDLYGALLGAYVQQGTPEFFMSAFESGTIHQSGVVEGALRPIGQIPRINDALPLFFLFPNLFLMREGCAAAAANLMRLPWRSSCCSGAGTG